MNAIDYAKQLFPWITQLGIADLLAQWSKDPALTGEELVAKVRETQQYKTRFAGIIRPDGTRRMSEADYLGREDDYRKLLRQYGRPDYEYDNPDDFVALFNQEIDPNEFGQRLQTYDAIQRSDNFVREAFYVYAGIPLTDDDLYQMVVNPTVRDQMINQYEATVATSPPDYPTFIDRVAEVGIQSVTRRAQQLRQAGVVSDDLVAKVRQVSAQISRQLADQLYHGGQNPDIQPIGNPVVSVPADTVGGGPSAPPPPPPSSPGVTPGPPTPSRLLNLNELLYAFQYALLGGAARSAGLALPTKDRLEALRQAGIDRAQALEGYATIASQGESLQGMLLRAGNDRFSVQDFEKAIFLHMNEGDLLRRAQAQEKALGQAGGGPALQQSNTGTLTQRGLRTW